MENGRCSLHGGKTPSGPDHHAFKHGRYATVFKGQMAKHFASMEADDNPLDLLPELATQRALLSSYIENVSQKQTVKKADLETISMLSGDVVRTATAIVKARNDTAVTLAEVKFIQAGMIRLMEKYVPNPDDRRAFIADLRRLIPGRNDADSDADQPASLPALTVATS